MWNFFRSSEDDWFMKIYLNIIITIYDIWVEVRKTKGMLHVAISSFKRCQSSSYQYKHNIMYDAEKRTFRTLIIGIYWQPNLRNCFVIACIHKQDQVWVSLQHIFFRVTNINVASPRRNGTLILNTRVTVL